jgi:hypothetical protein
MQLTQKAAQESKRSVPLKVTVVGIQGQILKEIKLN